MSNNELNHNKWTYVAKKSPDYSPKKGLTVHLRGENLESALRTLKRRMASEGVMKDMRRKEFYEPGSVKRRREKAEARKRWLKRQREMKEELGF